MDVVVDQADILHERVNTGGLNEAVRLRLQLLGERLRLRSRVGQAGRGRVAGACPFHCAGLCVSLSRGIAFVLFCPLAGRVARTPLCSPARVVTQTAARLGVTSAQVALQWLLELAPNVLLIPGTGSIAHLRENLASEGGTLDDEGLPKLDGVGVWLGLDERLLTCRT
jgi:hypothetical protein